MAPLNSVRTPRSRRQLLMMLWLPLNESVYLHLVAHGIFSQIWWPKRRKVDTSLDQTWSLCMLCNQKALVLRWMAMSWNGRTGRCMLVNMFDLLNWDDDLLSDDSFHAPRRNCLVYHHLQWSWRGETYFLPSIASGNARAIWGSGEPTLKKICLWFVSRQLWIDFTNSYLIIYTGVNTAWAQWPMSYL